MSYFHVVQDVESYSPEQVKGISDDNQQLVDVLNEIRLRIRLHPAQSNFRVVALFIIQHTVYQRKKLAADEKPQERLSIVCGSNAEQGYIGGAICAERAALCRLRFYENVKIMKVVITTDSEHPISPGALCK
jgi:cytidine deaminase